MSHDAGEMWTTIESDPGVFTELVREIGVKGVQFEEIYSLDADSLALLKPVYGLIFLFKWVHGDKDDRPVETAATDDVFFANQVINNACATQAILAVLLNRHDLDLGEELTNFRSFTDGMSPELKGLAISNSPSIRQAHNSFARPEPLVSDESRQATKDDDVYHFISYVPVNGALYELDGLKPGPIKLCSCSEDQWLAQVGPFIQQRMERYAANEIRFNLMAVIKDRILQSEERIQELQAEQTRIKEQSEAAEASEREDAQQAVQMLDAELRQLREDVAHEREKQARWHNENIQRRHNYIPFIFNFLKCIAEKQQLQPLIDDALKRTK